MSGIFISYRRGDGGGSAGRLYDRLERDFSRDQIFFDVDAISPGVDFVDLLQQKVDACGVLLAVIGRSWLDILDENGARRLDNPDDFVRIEVARGLSAGKRVIPVLVDGAEMPKSDRLPEDLKPIVRRNAVRLAHESFKADCDRLVRSLKETLAEIEASARKTEQQGPEGAARTPPQDIGIVPSKAAKPNEGSPVQEPIGANDAEGGIVQAGRQRLGRVESKEGNRLSATASQREAPISARAVVAGSTGASRRGIAGAIGMSVALGVGIWFAPQMLADWRGDQTGNTPVSTTEPELKSPVQTRFGDAVQKPGKTDSTQLPNSKAANSEAAPDQKTAKTEETTGKETTLVDDRDVMSSKLGIERVALEPPDAAGRPGGKSPDAQDVSVLGGRRVALVIGNAAYEAAPDLGSPRSDANLIADSLESSGFSVTRILDGTQSQMKRALLEFGRALRDSGVEAGLFYYAGYGVQVNGANYLIPTNAVVNAEDEIDIEGINVDSFLATMSSSQAKTNIIILDASRNNPFADLSRTMMPGLARVDAPQRTFIAYSAAPGQVALDGEENGNGPYASALATAIAARGLPLETVFKTVRRAVAESTGLRQIPWESSSLVDEFRFFGDQPVSTEPSVPQGDPLDLTVDSEATGKLIRSIKE